MDETPKALKRSHHPSLPNERVVAIRRLVDRALGSGAPEGALRMTTIKPRRKISAKEGALRLKTQATKPDH
jgi:hypothetical protein